MPLAKLAGLTFVGLKPVKVHIEVHLSAGLPSFALVGLPDTEVRESRERVRSALLNSGFEFPSQRITVNLAPADLPKGTASFDLAIALGIAHAAGQLPGAKLDHWVFAGELSLSGELTGQAPALALAVAIRQDNLRKQQHLQLMLPAAVAPQCAGVPDLAVYGARTLLEAASHLVGHGEPLQPLMAPLQQTCEWSTQAACLSEVVGHESVKHALQVAASGHHHLRLVGPPGSGKSMLAQRLPSLLPPLSLDEALESSAIRNLKGDHSPSASDWLSERSPNRQRPYRNPHPSTSLVALIGGGCYFYLKMRLHI